MSEPQRPETGVVGRVPVEESSAPEPKAVTGLPAGAAATGAARTGSIVPVWRPAPTVDVLVVDYQRIFSALAERRSEGDGVMSCQDLTVVRERF